MFTRAVYVFWLVQRFLENSNLLSFKEIDIWESNWDTYMIVRKEYKYILFDCTAVKLKVTRWIILA